MVSLEAVIDRGQFILGQEVTSLENNLANFVGSKHVITNANGTDALVLALRALNIGPGDEVIVPAFTFFATAEAVSLVGAKPIFVDIIPETYNIDPECVRSSVTSKTKAIIPVSLYGLCADFNLLNSIAEEYELAVIEDAAQSFGASYHGKRSCNLSTISCTSFFPSKPLGAYGDGGACFTNNDELAKKLKELRTHGQQMRYVHTNIGYNSRLDTLQAAILLKKLEIFPSEIEARELVAKKYRDSFQGKLKMQTIPANLTSVYAQFTIETRNRPEFQAKMNEVGIPTTVHYPVPLHRQPAYQQDYKDCVLKNADYASGRVVSLPMHPYLDEKTQNFIIENTLKFASH